VSSLRAVVAAVAVSQAADQMMSFSAKLMAPPAAAAVEVRATRTARRPTKTK
jgi:hypothetical protein